MRLRGAPSRSVPRKRGGVPPVWVAWRPTLYHVQYQGSRKPLGCQLFCMPKLHVVSHLISIFYQPLSQVLTPMGSSLRPLTAEPASPLDRNQNAHNRSSVSRIAGKAVDSSSGSSIADESTVRRYSTLVSSCTMFYSRLSSWHYCDDGDFYHPD